MGQVKNQWIRDEERGYSLPDPGEKFLCAGHYDDQHLRDFILANSSRGICSYCGRRQRVIDLHDFVEYTAGKITEHYGDPQNEGLYYDSSIYDDEDEVIPGFQRVGGFVAPAFAEYFESARELLDDVGLNCEDSQLDEDIENCFMQQDWVQRHATTMTEGQELTSYWRIFANMVMHEQRFTFFRRPEFNSVIPSGDNGLYDILTEISDRISQHGLIKEIDTGTIIYRCRYYDPTEETVSSFNHISSPPSHLAKQSRMSPAGVSMFYGAFDIHTAELESSPDGRTTTDHHTVGKFTTKKTLKVLDLTTLPATSFWMNGDREGINFLWNFRKEITKRIERDDRIHIEYVPSQVFTEYLRYIYRTNDNQKIDGVIYPSSIAGSANIVLFCGQYSSRDILELIELL